MVKTIAEINQKIRNGDVRVVTAEEMSDIVDEIGAARAAEEVDVVTTGTFGAMCSSGVFLNFGHSETPIKMTKTWLNNVESYSGLAAVDTYIGATQLADDNTRDHMTYGGAHVIEDLIRGKEIELRAESYTTDCYPRKELTTTITIDDLNQALMVNPRNAYQRYDAATNGSKKIIHTYMGELLPEYGNVTYSGAGILSPLTNNPTYRGCGCGTRIFIGGAQGHIVDQGTQCSSGSGYGTIMTTGNLKEMSSDFVRAAIFDGYGISLYLGIGIPIPILDAGMAQAAAVRDKDITVNVKDYSLPIRDRPAIRKVTYEELRSGQIELNGRMVPTSSISSFRKARQIAGILKEWISAGNFLLGDPVDTIPPNLTTKPMKETQKLPLVGQIMAVPVTIEKTATVTEAAKKMHDCEKNHIPVVSGTHLEGIITSWDIARAVSENNLQSVEKYMSGNVITCRPEERAEVAADRMHKAGISSMPVVDAAGNILGLITAEDLSRLVTGRVCQ